MMKRILCTLLAVLLCYTALAEAMDVTGTWILTGAEVYGIRLAPETIGVEMTVIFREDGTAEIHSADADTVQSEKAEWWVAEDCLVVRDENGDDQTFLYQDGMLWADMGDGFMIFTREGAAPAVVLPETPVPAADVPAETLEGTWVLTCMMYMNMSVTPESIGVQEGFTLKNGMGMYAITDDEGQIEPISITYTVTEVEDVGTQIVLTGAASDIKTLHITEDGVLFSEMNGVLSLFERVVEEDLE